MKTIPEEALEAAISMHPDRLTCAVAGLIALGRTKQAQDGDFPFSFETIADMCQVTREDVQRAWEDADAILMAYNETIRRLASRSS